jgi:hypothetical protein
MESRRDFFGRGKKIAAAALGAHPVVESLAALADVPQLNNWQQGIRLLFEMTDRKNLEYGDVFLIFKSGAKAWSDFANERERTGLILKANWDKFSQMAVKEGGIAKSVDIHVHGNREEDVFTSRTGPDGQVRGERVQQKAHGKASPPSSHDIRALLSQTYLDENMESKTLPPHKFRIPNMAKTNLVLNVQNKQGWYYEEFAADEIKKNHPDVMMPIPNSIKGGHGVEFDRRIKLLSDTVLRFKNASSAYGGDIKKMQTNPDGKKIWAELERAYANLGIMIRHVTYEQLLKEPPGAGVSYGKASI